MKRKIPDSFGYLVTMVDIEGIPRDGCTVFFSYQPVEHDTNTQAGCEIESVVWDDGEEMIDGVSPEDIKALEVEALEYLADWQMGADDDRADAMREQRAEND